MFSRLTQFSDTTLRITVSQRQHTRWMPCARTRTQTRRPQNAATPKGALWVLHTIRPQSPAATRVPLRSHELPPRPAGQSKTVRAAPSDG